MKLFRRDPDPPDLPVAEGPMVLESLSEVAYLWGWLACGQADTFVVEVVGLVVAALSRASGAVLVLNDGDAETHLLVSPTTADAATWTWAQTITGHLAGPVAVAAAGTVERTRQGVLAIRASTITPLSLPPPGNDAQPAGRR